MNFYELLRENGELKQEVKRLKKALSLCCDSSPIINSSLEIADLFIKKLAGRNRERFYSVLLDNKHRVIEEHLVSIGTLNQSLVHPRETFKKAVERNAAAIIIVHNHPSGDVNPSSQDVEITKRLKEVGEIVGIRLLDSIIVGGSRYFSFVDEDMIF